MLFSGDCSVVKDVSLRSLVLWQTSWFWNGRGRGQFVSAALTSRRRFKIQSFTKPSLLDYTHQFRLIWLSSSYNIFQYSLLRSYVFRCCRLQLGLQTVTRRTSTLSKPSRKTTSSTNALRPLCRLSHLAQSTKRLELKCLRRGRFESQWPTGSGIAERFAEKN